MAWVNFQHHPRRSLRRGMLFFGFLSSLLVCLAIAETLAIASAEATSSMRWQRLATAWIIVFPGLLLTLSCAIPWYRRGHEGADRHKHGDTSPLHGPPEGEHRQP